jgi:hypothetical protein
MSLPPAETRLIDASGRTAYRATEGDVQHDYFVGQFKTLIRRHKLEDVILVRVLTDHYQLVANTAKAGQLAKARRQLIALARDIELPADEELSLSTSVAELPVWALIHWLDDQATEALDRLQGALENSGRLAATYGHGYLSSRRIYIGVNMSRVLMTMGDSAAAHRLVDSLIEVAAGDRSRWPFTEPDSLSVPLRGAHRSIMAWHLDRAKSFVAERG